MRKRNSFTLIELVMVISIIGILVAIVVISMRQAEVKNRDAERVTDINSINTALQNYGLLENHQYPYAGCIYATDTVLDQNFKKVLVPNFLPTMPVDPLTPTSTYSNEQYVYLSTDSNSVVEFQNPTTCHVTDVTIGARNYYLYAFLETTNSPLSNSNSILAGLNTGVIGPFPWNGNTVQYNTSDPRGIVSPTNEHVNNAYIVRSIGQ